eukprot:226052-Pleurochrysis_carterae.AAC.2
MSSHLRARFVGMKRFLGGGDSCVGSGARSHALTSLWMSVRAFTFAEIGDGALANKRDERVGRLRCVFKHAPHVVLAAWVDAARALNPQLGRVQVHVGRGADGKIEWLVRLVESKLEIGNGCRILEHVRRNALLRDQTEIAEEELDDVAPPVHPRTRKCRLRARVCNGRPRTPHPQSTPRMDK